MLQSEGAAVGPVHRVWWNREALPEIEAPGACVTQWGSWRPRAGAEGAFITVSMTMPDGSARLCRTVEDWHEAKSRGGEAHSTLEMSMESHFIERAAAYAAIAHLVDAPRSGFASERWPEWSRHLISCDDDCSARTRVVPEGVRWTLEPNRVAYEDNDRGATARILARGDLDGDGWEDLLVSTGEYARHGSLRTSAVQLFTCRESGRVIDVTPRLVAELRDPVEFERHRLDLRDSFGLPEGVPIELRGDMGQGGGRVAIAATLLFADGFVTGSYRVGDGGAPWAVEGTLGPGGALALSEFALGTQPNARFTLRWKRDGDAIAIEGRWHESVEGERVRLTGTLPPRSK